jgi:solute carrier family 31 (copper transporter), member 1
MSDHHDHGNMHDVASSTTFDPHAGHDMMDHGSMDHGSMDHGSMDHGSMDHSSMDHSSMDHGSMNHSSMDHGMKMYFHASNEATILFYSWTTSTAAGMFGSCIVIMVLAVLYEALKVFRERLFYSAEANKTEYYNGDSQRLPTDENHVAIAQPSSGKSKSSCGAKMFNKAHIVQTFLHVIQLGISYLLMLIFMTYNVWLCLSVVVGAGLGYFLFGWMKTRLVDSNEHCH